MLLTLAWSELRQQLRGHVFRVVFAISALMVGGALAIDALRVGLDGVEAGAPTIVRIHLVWTLFYLFTAAAFVGEAVLRDDLSGLAPIVRATPVSPAAYLYGRALGGFGAVALCFLSVPLSLAVGAAVLGWAVGPADFGWSLFVLALPNLFLASALFTLLATRTGSMAGCLLGAVALLLLYGLGREGGAGVPVLLEPFGFAAVERGAPLLPNRMLWIGVAVASLLFARPSVSLAGKRTEPDRITTARPPQATSPAVPQFGRALALAQLGALARLWAPALSGAELPVLLARLIESFQLVPITAILFFSGELYWNERGTGVAPLVTASPVSPAIVYLGKLAALAAILLALALGTGLAAAVLHLAGGGAGAAQILSLYVLPKWLDWMIFAALALAIQALSPNKLSGWGFIVLYLIASLGLDQLGLRDPHWRYGFYPGAPLPPELTGIAGAAAFRWGWAGVALGLVAIGCIAAIRADRR
jgi:hypothetical protein